jgi:hypothetical protein
VDPERSSEAIKQLLDCNRGSFLGARLVESSLGARPAERPRLIHRSLRQISEDTMRILLALVFFIASPDVQAQSFTSARLKEKIDRNTFMSEGRAGSVALSAGAAIDSKDKAAANNDFRPLDDGKCYSVIGDRPLSKTGRLYFAVNHNVPEPPYKNAFLAVQVVRIHATNTADKSDVAVSRNASDSWVSIGKNSAARPVGEGKPLARSPEEFAAAHTLEAGNFNPSAIDKFFAGTKVEWHARLPRRNSSGATDGNYSSLDPELAGTWSGLINGFQLPKDRSYQRLVRSYLISLEFGNQSDRPIIFYTEPLGADLILVRISSSSASGFNVDRTFSLALGEQDCLFLQASANPFGFFAKLNPFR